MTGWNARRKALILAIILIVVPSVVAVAVGYSNRALYPHERALPPVAGLKELPVKARLDELAEFQTHLPILVLEFSEEPQIHAEWDDERGYMVRIIADPFVEGSFSLYNNETKPNRLTDEPEFATKIRARLRGNTSMRFPKRQFFIKMVNEDGSQNEVDVMGMGADWEWIVNISYIDKSLLRNYMCMAIAERVMGYAPETRYCEMFQKRGDEYEYMGVYLVMESIKRGKSRINLAKYDPFHAETPYILCRDRYSDRNVILDTYSSIHDFSLGYLAVRYPSDKRITDKSVAFIEADVTRFEKALYSDNPAEFIGYRDLINVDSFIDYFILNEYFANYDAGINSYYSYKDLRARLSAGPIWDMDQGIANNMPYVFEPEACAMQSGVWFDRLVKDGFFSRRLVSRYKQLRGYLLSDRYIEGLMDEITAYLGDARHRDWNRWHYNDPDALLRDRVKRVHPALSSNTRNFEEEIVFMKDNLRLHGAWLDQHLKHVVLGEHQIVE